jgi:RsiW-degrading membrane proteinase PrsW (M82 family)
MFRLILIAAAVIPAVYLLIRVYRADRLEKEPTGLLVSLVVLGIFSTALAGVAEALGSILLTRLIPQRGLIYNALLYFIIVGISEEGAKYLLLKARTWKSPHFNFRFDGVVYAVFVSLGFALWENIRYVLTFGFGTALARAVTAIPGHACFGVFMGVWYGVAKKYDLSGMEPESREARKRALLIPILLHGAYDFIASMESELMSIVFLLFVGWLFRSALNLVKKTSAEDSPLPQQTDVFNPDI